MKTYRIWVLLLLIFSVNARQTLAADSPQSVSLIPCSRVAVIQALKIFALNLRAYGVAPVNAIPEQIMLFDGHRDAHPMYEFRNGHQDYNYDSCNGYTMFNRDDLARPLTKEEIKAQSPHWLEEAKVKAIANGVKDALLPTAEMGQFVPSDMLGAVGSVENGVQVTKFMHANIAVVYYDVQQVSRQVLGNLRVEVDRISGQIAAIGYINVKCEFDQTAVTNLLAIAKGKVANPIIRPFMDKWGCCKPVLTTGLWNEMEFLDLTDSKLKSFDGFYFASQSQRQPHTGCHIIHNGESFMGEMFHPGNSLFFEPVVLNGAPLIAGVYFPRFEINVEAEQDTLSLNGLMRKTGKKVQLTLGSTQAIIGGKAVALSNPPQLIDGYLYLPYELLKLRKGVLARWEPQKNTLWVETPFKLRG